MDTLNLSKGDARFPLRDSPVFYIEIEHILGSIQAYCCFMQVFAQIVFFSNGGANGELKSSIRNRRFQAR